MKKTLIAIAALAATGAFAQSSVTISGTMDVGFQRGTVESAAVAAAAASMNPTTFVVTPAVVAAPAGNTTTTTFAGNGSSTTAVNIAGVEDLGGGMKASFFIENNPAMAGEANASTFANGQRFLGLEGGFGAIKLGAANSAILQTALAGDTFGTAVGGNYTSRFSSTGNGAGVRVIRNANTLRYDTPNFSGFTASYELGFQNKDVSGNNTTSPGVGILGARYAAGPLTVAFATGTVKASAVTVASDAKQAHTLLSASYVMGDATLFAGLTNYKSTTATTTADETSSMNFGVRYNVSPVLNVHASMANRKDKRAAFSAAPQDASLLALGTNYSLSKRTTAYGRYESLDTNKANNTVGDTTGKGTLLAIGIRHTF